MIKSILSGSAAIALLAVSVLSYAGTFSQGSSLSPQASTQQNSNTNQQRPTATSGAPAHTGAPAKGAEDKAKAPTDVPVASKPLDIRSEVDKPAAAAAETYLATAYSLPGHTAGGKHVARGLIAADLVILPLGTRVRLDAGAYSGEYEVADAGTAVKGRRIDIWMPSYREACHYGLHKVKLTVLSYGLKRSSAPRRTRRRSPAKPRFAKT